MNKADTLSRLTSTGVVPIVRGVTHDEAFAIVDAVSMGGINILEVTMGTEDAVALMAKLAVRYPDLLIGAGTVLDPGTAEQCINAGASFIVSPSTNPETIRFCNAAGAVSIPGALTPTEIETAWNAGADVVKVFPVVCVGGPQYIKMLKGPLPMTKLMTTGGVTLDNAGELIAAGAEFVGVTTDLVDAAAIREGEPERLTELARKYLYTVAGARYK